MNFEILSPGIVRFRDAMSLDFCQEIIDKACKSDLWRKSKTVRSKSHPDETFYSMLSDHRNSSQQNIDLFDEELKERFTEEILKVFDVYDEVHYKVPKGGKNENPYVLRYEPGEKFTQHSDYVILPYGHRIYSSLTYLNESVGGDLWFPNHGLAVPNEAGSVVIFPSHELYQHQSNPVVSGVKYSIPFWLYYPEYYSLSDLAR